MVAGDKHGKKDGGIDAGLENRRDRCDTAIRSSRRRLVDWGD
jgi:hypothetical protein